MNIPGDSTTTETLLPGIPFATTISPLGDRDWFRLNLTVDFSYGVTVTTSSVDLTQRVEILDPDQSFVTADNGSNTSAAEVSFQAFETGVFFAAVMDSFDNDAGGYQIELNAEDNIRNSTASDRVILGGETISSAIDVIGDVDFIGVDVTDGLSYGLIATTTTADLTQRLELFNGDGDFVMANNGSSETAASISFTAEASERYFVSIRDSFDNDAGDYELTLNADDNILNSDLSETVMDGSMPFVSAIDVIGDVDFIGVDVTNGLSYGVIATTTTADLTQRLELFNGDGDFVMANNGSSETAASISFTAEASERYFVSIRDNFNDDAGDYELTLNADDNILNSDLSETVMDGSMPFVSAIDVIGDVDFIGVDVTDGLSYGVIATTTTTDLTQRLELFNGDGDFVMANNGSSETAASISFTAEASERYFVSIRDSFNDDAGDYELSLNDRDIYSAYLSNAHAIGFGDVVHSSINVLGDVDSFAIELVAGQTYSYCLSTPTSDLTVRLAVFDTEFDFVDADNGGQDDPAMVEFTATETGTYYVQVSDSFNDDVGDYSLITFSAGDDTIFGSAIGEELHGGQGTDFVSGLGGDDMIGGGEGDDTLSGGEGNDDISGDDDDDLILPGTGNDAVDGGDGIDTVSYSDVGAVQVRLFGNRAAGDGFRDTLINIENIIGSDFDDFLAGDAQDNLIEGEDGNDRILGNRGNDHLKGGLGDDIMRGGIDDDLLEGGADDDRLQGELGNDTLLGDAGEDFLFGGNGFDILNGGADDDLLSGGAQADVFQFETGSGFDRIIDWEDGLDVIDLTDFGFTDFTDVAAISSQTAAGVRLDFVTGDSLLIGGLNLVDFTADDVNLFIST